MSAAAVLAAVSVVIAQAGGTPYITGGDSPAGTDCSGLASWVANAATGRPIYGDRFSTANEGPALSARGFILGTGDGDDLVIGWTSGHTARCPTAATSRRARAVASASAATAHISGNSLTVSTSPSRHRELALA